MEPLSPKSPSSPPANLGATSEAEPGCGVPGVSPLPLPRSPRVPTWAGAPGAGVALGSCRAVSPPSAPSVP